MSVVRGTDIRASLMQIRDDETEQQTRTKIMNNFNICWERMNRIETRLKGIEKGLV